MRCLQEGETYLHLSQFQLRCDLLDLRAMGEPFIQRNLGAPSDDELVLSARVPYQTFVGLRDHSKQKDSSETVRA